MEHSTKNPIYLKKGETLEITSKSVITVSSGMVWVTYAGDEKDYVLKTGDSLKLNGSKPVIEAIQSSYVTIHEQPSKFKLFSLILSWNADVFG